MPYSAGEYLVLVEGDTGNQDPWVNTWCFKDTLGSQDPQDVVDILHAFYVDIAPLQGAAFSSDSATVRDLFTNVLTPASWVSQLGGDASPILPPQIAVRVSLYSAIGQNGGPFIGGWSNAANDTGGVLDSAAKTDITGGLTTMAAALSAADWSLQINRPTSPETVTVTQAKVGSRFDVIRRRANEIAENYSVVPF